MKKTIFFIGMFLALPLQAAYPDRLGDFSDPQLKSIKDIYQTIYDDTFQEGERIEEAHETVVLDHNREILKRVREHNLKRLFGIRFTDDEINNLCNLRLPQENLENSIENRETTQNRSEFGHLLTSTTTHNLTNTVEQLKSLCLEEKELLIMETTLARRMGLMTIFSDGSDHNSPFDIITEWNRIDKVLFGEKAILPKPSFLQNVPREVAEPYDESFLEPECWQDEREESDVSDCGEGYSNKILARNTQSPSASLAAAEVWDEENDYQEENDVPCITKLFEDFQEPLIEVNAHSLVAEVNTTPFFGPTMLSAPPGGDFEIFMQKSAHNRNMQTQVPEVHKVAQEVEQEEVKKAITGDITRRFAENNSMRKMNDAEVYMTAITAAAKESKIRTDYLDRLLEFYHTESELSLEEKHRESLLPAYQWMVSYFQGFRDAINGNETVKIRNLAEILEEFNAKKVRP